MIFNPVRSGGEKEYKIKVAAATNITTSATKQKPGHVFQATANINRSPKMEFTDPDTGEQTSISALSRHAEFVMPCADVLISY